MGVCAWGGVCVGVCAWGCVCACVCVGCCLLMSVVNSQLWSELIKDVSGCCLRLLPGGCVAPSVLVLCVPAPIKVPGVLVAVGAAVCV